GAGAMAALASFARHQGRLLIFVLPDGIEGQASIRIGRGDLDRVTAADPGKRDIVREVDDARILRGHEVRLRAPAGKYRDLRLDGDRQQLKQPCQIPGDRLKRNVQLGRRRLTPRRQIGDAGKGEHKAQEGDKRAIHRPAEWTLYYKCE